MKIVCLYTDKGGVGKTTAAPNIAASLKNAHPSCRVGLMDLCSDHGHLSKRYAPNKERDLLGAWAIVEALIDPRLRRDEANADRAILASTTPLRVIPGTSGTDGCVEFINVGVGLSHNLRGARVFGSADDAKRFGGEFVDAIERVLRLDYLVVDLPGMVDEGMVRSVLPHCYAVTIPVDVRSYMNMAEGGVLVDKLRKMDVEVSCLLRTFVEDGESTPSAQVGADEAVGELSKSVGVPVLAGGIPDRRTLPQSIEPRPASPGEPVEIGLYVMAARKELNGNQRSVINRTIVAIEGAMNAMLAEADALAASK